MAAQLVALCTMPYAICTVCPWRRFMKRSTSRILTTHTGSLPRPADLIEMIRDAQAGKQVDEAAFEARVKSAVAETVQKQIDAGIDSISDGEEGKPSYATYVKDRLTGFGGSMGPML